MSKANPLDYNAQGWVDIRELAASVYHLRKHDIYCGNSVSAIVNLIVHSVASMSEAKFTTSDDALAYLNSLGFRITQVRGPRGARIIKNISLQSADDVQPSDPITDRAAQLEALLSESADD
jgi:hypothetical protein